VNKSSAPILAGTLAGVLALSLACSGDGPTAVVAGPPASLLITGGQDQSIIVGKELPTILEVKIVDAQQRPVKGQVVNFRVISGGGSVFAGVAITSDSGIAKERWTLGTVASDSQRVEARAVDDKGTALVFGVFRAVALPDVPATVRKTAGDSQVVAAAATASDSLSVAVVDRYGNPVPRSTVRWTVTSGGGRVSADSSVANDAGQAKVRWTVGQRVDSAQRVTAQHGTLTPVTFSAAVKAADAAALQLSQQAAGAASGGAFVTAPKVRIRDAYGNQVTTSTAAVTLTVSAGASVVGTATTNAVNGEATFSTAGLSGTAGNYTLTYSAAGLTAATQTIALTAGAPSQLAVTTQPAGAVSGATFTTQPVVELRDAQGNRTTSTLTVTASVASGGGTLVGTAAVAAVNGVATFTNLRIDRAAAHTLTFTVATPSLTATSGAFTITPGAASQLAVTTSAAGARSGAAFTTQPVLEVRDAAGNRVTGSTASITATVAGATVVGTATVSAVDGVATYTALGLSGTVGTYTVTFAATGLTSATQSLSLTAGAATQLAIATQAGDAYSDVRFGIQPIVEVRDASGNLTSSTAAIAATPNVGATIIGTATINALNGRATFSDLGISASAGSHTVSFSSPGLTTASQTVAVGQSVGGVISTSQTWSGTLVVANDVRILDGTTVTVAPGTTLLVDNSSANTRQILVEGVLTAVSQSASPITFRARFPTGGKNDWKGIRFRNTQNSSANGSGWIAGSHLKNVIIRHANTGIYLYNQGLAIDSTTFEDNTNAIELRKTNGVFIARSVFRRNTYGVWTAYEPFGEPDTYGDFVNTWLSDNSFISNTVGIEINPNQRATNNLNITSNWFEDNGSGLRWGGGGYGIRDANPMTVSGNRFWGNGVGAFFKAYGGTFNISIANNSFGDNSQAIMLDPAYNTMRITDNFFYRNDASLWMLGVQLSDAVENNLFSEDSTVFRLTSGGGGRYFSAKRNVIHSTQKIIVDLEAGMSSFSFQQNVVTATTSSGTWFSNRTPTNISFESNFIDWGGSTSSAKIFDGIDNADYGIITLMSPLATATASTTTRAASEIPTRIQDFDRGMLVSQRTGPRRR